MHEALEHAVTEAFFVSSPLEGCADVTACDRLIFIKAVTVLCELSNSLDNESNLNSPGRAPDITGRSQQLQKAEKPDRT